ncbi:DNA primase large subunit-like [Tribolium madens]|uniref:DNA primase large subunit-like n=1 Tax=Tribolium madens TaxID=41895 RepID=UPI001CF76408|nr:DNA primase large subunit-like [Tribolium madens]
MYRFNVSLYESPPSGEESLPNVVEMCRQRLILYKTFQNDESHFLDKLKTLLNEKSSPLVHLLEIGDSPQIVDARKCDYISHWALRVAYSRTDYDTRAFFVKNELNWFRIRFNNLSSNIRAALITESRLTAATDPEKTQFGLTGSWYKVYFTEVLELLKLHMYPMSKGYVFIPDHKVVYWFIQQLQKDLGESFEHLRKIHPVCFDEHLQAIISMLDLVKPIEYNPGFGSLELEQLPEKSKKFPLCMQIQYETLQKTHHLKYFSRAQFGFFLKGIGLSLKDALEFWKREFVKIMDEERFSKEYAYYFKHQYGVIGAKINYKPFNCEKIQNQGVTSGQVHGCAFKHWDKQVLAARLRSEISDDEIASILSLKEQNEYTKACNKYFKCVHNCNLGETVLNHPNEYFQKACQVDVVDIEDLFVSDTE